MNRITPEMTILEVIFRFQQTEPVFRRYDAAAKVCLCCQALFDSLQEVARKYGLDLHSLLADLEQAAGTPPAEKNQSAAPGEGDLSEDAPGAALSDGSSVDQT
jgi:hypothetical protein